MISRNAVVLIFVGLLASSSAHADEPKAFACSFGEGTTFSYDSGQYARESAAPLAFGIASIDTKGQVADLKTERGIGQLRVVQAVGATHFIEIVTEGFLHITTVYDKDDAKGAHPAVHSRHFGILGQPVVSHYEGFCEATG